MREKPLLQRSLQRITSTALILWLLVGCSVPTSAPAPVPPTASPVPPTASTSTVVPREARSADRLSDEEVTTLSSLKKVDDYPLYTMHYCGAYAQRASSIEGAEWLVRASPQDPDLTEWPTAWACSLFAALGDADHMLYGRNFDWEYSPAVLLFTDPPDGHASVSMVDIAYLGFGGARAEGLTDLPLGERRALLRAPFLPFDGMNEHGLAVGMAAVPASMMPHDPDKGTIDSLMVIREMLDRARNVDEAIAGLQSYNITMQGSPPLHYLMADSWGRAALLEFHQGQMVVISNETPWYLATNFLRASVSGSVEGMCWRHDRISRRLSKAEGRMTARDAMDLLAGVSQDSTQWSVLYGMSTGDVKVTMGRRYDNPHTFHLSFAGK